MTGKTTGYVSVGFSEQYNVMAPADVYVGWIDESGQPIISDRKNPNGYEYTTIDENQVPAYRYQPDTLLAFVCLTVALKVCRSQKALRRDFCNCRGITHC